MSVVWRHQILLGLVAALVFFTNLGGYALFDEDEPKNAVCGAEMYERGDWIVPTFNAELRTDKPILIYWWMHLSFRLFGVSEFSARLGSAMLASGTLFLTYFMGRKLYSDMIALQASLILATCLMFTTISRAVTPDATLIFCLMLAFSSYIWAVSRRRDGHFSGAESDATSKVAAISDLVPQSRVTAIPMYAAMGLAILAKGPIGVLLPCTIIGLFLLITALRKDLVEGQLQVSVGPWWRRWLLTLAQVMRPTRILQAGMAMRLILGAGIVLAVALPWYVVVGMQTDGAWIRGFLGDHNLGRFLEPKENHSGPIFYYAVVLLLGCFPWSVFLPMAIWQLRGRLLNGTRWNDSDRLVACWAGVWFVFFSLARTKLPNYVLPMYPALALITARYLNEWKVASVGWGQVSFRNSCRALAVAGLLIMVGFAITASILLPGEEYLMAVGLIPAAGAGLAYMAAQRERRERALQILTGTAITMAVVMIGIAPSQIANHLDSPKLAAAARQASGKQRPDIASIEVFSPSLVFYARQPVSGLRKPSDVTEFFQRHPDGFVVTRADRVDKLPENGRLVEVARCRRFLRRYDVVLLAAGSPVAMQTEENAVR